MAHKAFSNRTTAWLLATWMIFFGEAAMASSLKLADPAELAGKWLATLSSRDDSPASQVLQDKPSNVCVIELQLKLTLGKGADCLSAWLAGEKAIGWFNEPDGIAITGNDGSKILFLSRQRDGSYKAALNPTLVITLVRQAH
ncbi:AprI/Inh family metalloprotease inhibitor [Pseudomonas arsenicoxydans]|uniref:Alkaline proteinase inhibitor n=1 Tax=Pseudomonas arsenicoxydans TaxID=702115 RepID=A0A502HQX5_9PSED|nr:AprI/Inh family metalloprotease inhibitor [Pseudomonas arsenicoxydans]TPG76225.1 alkaline proteinase inhibitor [Pseudomonas arsenicoxydans]